MDQTKILGDAMGVVLVALIIVICAAIAITWMIQRHADAADGNDRFSQPLLTQQPTNSKSGRDEGWEIEEPRDPQEIAALLSELDEEFESESWIQYSVSGESRANNDGTERQSILRRLRRQIETSDTLESRLIRLIREPRNRYDPNAIGVFCAYGQVGYMSREDAEDLAPWIDSGRPLYACVHKLLGGDADRPTIGIWLRLSKFSDFGEAREAAEELILAAEREALKAKRQAEKEAKQLAKRAEKERAAALKREEREATKAAKRKGKAPGGDDPEPIV